MKPRILDYQAAPLVAVAAGRGLLGGSRLEALKTTALAIESVIDRTGALDFGLDCVVLDPMPAVDPAFSSTFAEVCDAEAEALVRAGRPLSVYWSGGLDSTGVVCALLKAGAAPLMTVVLSGASIAEYPLFYARSVAPLRTREIGPSVFRHICFDETIVTGELGDQLFGSIWVKLYEDRGRYADSLTEHWHQYLTMKYEGKDVAALIEMYEPLVARAPFEVRCAYDFMWWLNFSCKWQHVTLRMAAGVAADVAGYLASARPFYRAAAFQQWAMREENHRERKTADEANTYKLALRDYILSYTGDEDYVRHKKKVGSLPMKYAPRYMMLLDDGERVRFGGPSCDDAAAYNARYGGRFDYLFTRNNERETTGGERVTACA